MSTRSSRAPQGQLAVLATVLAEAAGQAVMASSELLHSCPDVGDHGTQRVVDRFTEQASDALRALAESVQDCVHHLGGSAPGPSGPGTSAEEQVR